MYSINLTVIRSEASATSVWVMFCNMDSLMTTL